MMFERGTCIWLASSIHVRPGVGGGWGGSAAAFVPFHAPPHHRRLLSADGRQHEAENLHFLLDA